MPQARSGFYQMGRDAYKRWTEYERAVFPHRQPPQPPYLPHDPRHQDWRNGWTDAQREAEKPGFR